MSRSNVAKETYKLDHQKKPDGMGILGNWVGVSVAVVIVLAFLLWWFGVRKQKEIISVV